MRHDRLVTLLIAIWAVFLAQAVRAATLSEFMGGNDWQSLQWAAGLSLLGGSLRTILSLQSRPIVWNIASEASWDAVKALVAGMLTFVVIEAVRSLGGAVPTEARFLAVLVAGIFRMDSIYWMRDAGKEWLDSKKRQLINQDPPKGGSQ